MRLHCCSDSRRYPQVCLKCCFSDPVRRRIAQFGRRIAQQFQSFWHLAAYMKGTSTNKIETSFPRSQPYIFCDASYSDLSASERVCAYVLAMQHVSPGTTQHNINRRPVPNADSHDHSRSPRYASKVSTNIHMTPNLLFVTCCLGYSGPSRNEVPVLYSCGLKGQDHRQKQQSRSVQCGHCSDILEHVRRHCEPEVE